jgi:hypothetical protein
LDLQTVTELNALNTPFLPQPAVEDLVGRAVRTVLPSDSLEHFIDRFRAELERESAAGTIGLHPAGDMLGDDVSVRQPLVEGAD